MQLSEQAKKNILNSILEWVFIVQDRIYHHEAWVKGVYGVGFDDLCCDFFGDCDPMLENYKEYNLTEKQYHILKDFRDQFEAFSDENSWPPFFIDTSEWAKIMEKAKEVLKAFNYERPTEEKGESPIQK